MMNKDEHMIHHEISGTCIRKLILQNKLLEARDVNITESSQIRGTASNQHETAPRTNRACPNQASWLTSLNQNPCPYRTACLISRSSSLTARYELLRNSPLRKGNVAGSPVVAYADSLLFPILSSQSLHGYTFLRMWLVGDDYSRW